jgi:hypothetical protein
MSDHSDESDDGSFSDGGDAQNAKKHWLGKAKEGGVVNRHVGSFKLLFESMLWIVNH